MHSLPLIAALGLVSQAYCAAFIRGVEYRPRNNVVERAPAPPEITVTSIPEVSRYPTLLRLSLLTRLLTECQERVQPCH